MRRAPAALAALLLLACGPGSVGDRHDGGGGDPNDRDGDGWTVAQGDCNDDDPTVHPTADEICDHKDNDCDGKADEPCDWDGDGYSPAQGDCDDGDPAVSPGAIEVVGNMVDDDCDGLVDEVEPGCTETDGTGASDLAAAMGVCAPWLLSAQLNSDAGPGSHAVRPDYGSYAPRDGARIAVLSTGLAADEDDLGYIQPQPGTDFGTLGPNPAPQTKKTACYQGADAPEALDPVVLDLELQVPTNAHGFAFDLNFLSAEYPEYVGSAYNDEFLALLDSQAYSGNVSFDNKGNPISVNVAFFSVCDTELICMGSQQNTCAKNANELNGTGYELDDGSGMRIGGGTGWLTTTAPLVPGEKAHLRFVIFDEMDHLWDSAVLLDHFRWVLVPAGPPMTIG